MKKLAVLWYCPAKDNFRHGNQIYLCKWILLIQHTCLVAGKGYMINFGLSNIWIVKQGLACWFGLDDASCIPIFEVRRFVCRGLLRFFGECPLPFFLSASFIPRVFPGTQAYSYSRSALVQKALGRRLDSGNQRMENCEVYFQSPQGLTHSPHLLSNMLSQCPSHVRRANVYRLQTKCTCRLSTDRYVRGNIYCSSDLFAVLKIAWQHMHNLDH
jgi:hypothetical protein